MLPIFYNIKETCSTLFSKKNIFFYITACVLTYVIVISGLDWSYFVFMQTYPFTHYLTPAIAIGGMIPMFGLPLLYMYAKFNSKIKKNQTLLVASWCIAQAAMLGWILSSILKAFTGRVQPPRGLITTLVDSSRDWNFGFWEHGIFWGWPSSHTTVAFAMMFSLIALYPKNKYVLFPSLFYAFYIGIGITTHIHWFSEFVAGAIIGSVIGLIVGKSFRKKLLELNS